MKHGRPHLASLFKRNVKNSAFFLFFIVILKNIAIFVETIKQKVMITKSIEERAINLMLTGIDAVEAVKQAIIEEQNLIEEMIAQNTERSKQAKKQICKNVYGLIHLTY